LKVGQDLVKWKYFTHVNHVRTKTETAKTTPKLKTIKHGMPNMYETFGERDMHGL
jgi:hypothetical protein